MTLQSAEMGLFGTSGIRRTADRNLLEIALRTGLALGQSKKAVVVGRDTRTSSNALKHALISGLMSAGAQCCDAGVVPTPTLAVAARDFEAGVMITASHNPPEYNGIKVFNPNGSSYMAAQQTDVERALSGPLPTAPWQEMAGDIFSYPQAIGLHVEHIMQQVRIAAKTRIVVDCACGAGSVISPYLLRRMGCDVVGLNTHPSGFFPHDVEPTEANLKDLIAVCTELHAVGVAHDGDADRMMAVDERGRFVAGDKLLVLLAHTLKARQVVTTVDASMAIEEAGLDTVRTRVGDTYVSERLAAGGDFGGEPSGAWVLPKVSLCPDGVHAAGLLAAIASRHSLSSLVDAIPDYPIIRGSVAVRDTKFDAARFSQEMRPERSDTTDGSKLMFGDGWVLVRPSGTEPKIRITAQARTEARARELYDTAVRYISEGASPGGKGR